jgi:hypothetical protein
MRYPILVSSFLALSCAVVHAQLDIAIPAPSADVSTTYGVGVDSISAGAVQIKALTGATYTVGKSSSASLTETAQGELVLNWSLAYDPADGPYGTSVSLLLPLTPAWDIKDLSASPEIDYDVKAASAFPAINEQMEIGSNLYGDSARINNAALAQPKWTTLADTYQTVRVTTSSLSMNSWYSGPDAATTDWNSQTYQIGKAVKNLIFQPQVNWTSATVMKSGTTGTLYIRNVIVHSFEEGNPYPGGVGCTGTGFTVEDFLQIKSNLAQNYLGGSWYAYADTSSDPAKLNDSSVGSSTILLPAGDSTWVPSATYGALMTATLEKDVSSSTFLYHRYAGWAGLGTTLTGGNGGSLDLQPGPQGGALTAISFDLYAGPALGGTYTIDTTNIRRIIFKVSKSSVNDAEDYSVNIPVSQATSTTYNNFCVDATMLQQPGWYVADSLKGTPVPFSANDLTKLSWQIQIEDQVDPTKHNSANNTIAVNNVKFFGVCVYCSGIEGSQTRTAALRATYAGALQLSYAVDGTLAQIEVHRLDGARIASFREAASSQNLSLPVALSHGTYLVSVQGSRARQVALLSVVR